MNTNNEIVTMTPDEFAAKFAPAATPDSYFIRNRETGKLELHFDKADYDDLTDDQKREIKGAFLWGRRSGCWISRCKEPNLWRAEKIAKALGLADGGTTGEILCEHVKSLDLGARGAAYVETLPDDLLQEVLERVRLSID